MGLQGLGETHGEVELPPRRPAARLAEASDGAVGPHPDARPEDLARVVVDAVTQVQEHVGRRGGREGVTLQAHASRGGELHPDAVVRQRHGVVAGLGLFRVVAETRAIAAARLVRLTWIRAYVAGD